MGAQESMLKEHHHDDKLTETVEEQGL